MSTLILKNVQNPIDSYAKARSFLESFIVYGATEPHIFKQSLKLERVTHLLKFLSVSHRQLAFIHVAGTKGKGSVASVIASILASSGYRVGLFTSPHFHDFRERIQIITRSSSGIRADYIPRAAVLRIIQKWQVSLVELRRLKPHGQISFFEIYTALALQYFSEEHPDYVILEAGLGGRLDATNVVSPCVSIITRIGYDHTQILGRSLKMIAKEKAGIIKQGIPVITCPQRPTALREIKKQCKAKAASLFLLGANVQMHGIRITRNVSSFTLSCGKRTLSHLAVTLKGEHQLMNAALAAVSLWVLTFKGLLPGSLAFREGLRRSRVRGRFETICANPFTILDIAHNELSFQALSDTLKRYYPRKKILLIFAASRDKNVKRMINAIAYDTIILTSFKGPRALPARVIQKKGRVKDALITESFKEAFREAKALYTQQSLILVSGSFFLVAEAKKYFKTA